MATESNLCPTCKDAVRGLGNDKSQLLPGDSPYSNLKSHHLLFRDFHEAAQKGCFICNTIWKCLGQETRATWLKGIGHWDMSYSFYQREDVDDVMVLEILWSEPIDRGLRGTRFWIIPFAGIRLERKKKLAIREISTDTSSFSSLGLAYQWYMSCRACHEQCTQFIRSPRWHPTRLLDIGIKGDDTWKLHINSEDVSLSPNYMTLSYRWGSSPPPLMLTHFVMEEFRRGKLISDLPQTFRDADSQEDWEVESSMMRDVYTNSACNISATASLDPEGGLFRSRHQGDVLPGVLKSRNRESPIQWYFIYDKSYWDRQVSDTVLHRRGWVFQERLLAPRVLHFTEKQIFWECFTDQKCEGFPLGIPLYDSLKNFEPLFEREQNPLSLSAFNMWTDLVEAYSELDLTIRNDKLVALSGLARLFQEKTGDEYLAGLWRSRLPEFLDWRVEKPLKKLSSSYLAPSWSWASVDGPVKISGVSALYAPLVTIREVQVTSSKSDYTGQVAGGFIVVEGLLVQAICHDTGGFWKLEIEGAEISAPIMEDASDSNLRDGLAIHCLALSCHPTYSGHVRRGFVLQGLILKPFSGSSHDYVRIGHFGMHQKSSIERFGVSLNEGKGPVAHIRPDRLSAIKII